MILKPGYWCKKRQIFGFVQRQYGESFIYSSVVIIGAISCHPLFILHEIFSFDTVFLLLKEYF